MPRGLFNWTFTDVVRFLRDNNFRQSHIEGSHYFFTGSYKGEFRQVCVPFHGRHAIKPRTMKGIVTQSGIPKDLWI